MSTSPADRLDVEIRPLWDRNMDSEREMGRRMNPYPQDINGLTFEPLVGWLTTVSPASAVDSRWLLHCIRTMM